MISEPRMRGFTLLEMLVVLLIAGMALALTSQALSQYKRAHEQVSTSTQSGREYRLAERWFRESVSGLFAGGDPAGSGTAVIPGVPPDATVFRGEPRGFSGLSLLPVLAGQGIPTLQTWSITTSRTGSHVLILKENEKQLTLPFPGADQLTLHYLDAVGGTHTHWPPTQGHWPQLPAAIALELGPGSMLVAAVTGPYDPVIVPYEPDPI